MTPTIPTQLRQILLDYFDEGELITLCFDLGVDYESLPVRFDVSLHPYKVITWAKLALFGV